MTLVTSPFGYRTSALEVARGHDLRGKVSLITGAASGIGLETARAIASTGARVVLAVRDPARGSTSRDSIRTSHPDAEVDVLALDLADLTSVRRFVRDVTQRFERIDVLINNAGVMATPLERTADGYELQFATNHLGHFALFLGLAPLLRAATSPRVVALSSIGHRRSDVDFDDPNFERRTYDKWEAYGQSKTACSLFAVGIASRGDVANVSAFAVHPGGIMTGLQKFLPDDEVRAFGWVDDEGRVNERFKTPEQGASTSVWAALGDELAGHSGLYLEDCRQASPWSDASPMTGVMDYALDPVAADRLWDLSTELVARSA